jgi:5'-methylthioadenosine phosphorylase
MSTAVILGSAYHKPELAGLKLTPEYISTKFGQVELFKYSNNGKEGWVLFRHGSPHRFLPNQIPYRAHAAALKEVACDSLLVTSSVGVLDRSLPLDRPILLNDIIMLDNRLPDGTACSMFLEPVEGQGHLILHEGLFSKGLSEQLISLIRERVSEEPCSAVFAYVMGPRLKTPAENEVWTKLGGQVNSMTVAPEVVLANELEIPVAGLVIGHKYSIPYLRERLDQSSIDNALNTAQERLGHIVVDFLEQAYPVEFKNAIYRYESK